MPSPRSGSRISNTVEDYSARLVRVEFSVLYSLARRSKLDVEAETASQSLRELMSEQRKVFLVCELSKENFSVGETSLDLSCYSFWLGAAKIAVSKKRSGLERKF
jgi:hypothetical protein